MDKLKKSRKPVRHNVTKYCNEIKGMLQETRPDKEMMQVKVNMLREDFEKLESIDQKILERMIEDEKVTDEMIDEEYRSIEEYRVNYHVIKVKADTFFDSFVRSPAQSTVSEHNTDDIVNRKNVKYPKITLRKFDGDLREWLGFWAQFKVIHEDDNIATVDKFQYLMQSMVKNSKAYLVVGSYPQSEENYFKAVAALQKRFGKEELLIEVYVRELLKLVMNPTERKGNLSRMYDTLESYLRALESLGVTSEKYAAMLFPLVESGLSEELLRTWQRSALYKLESQYDNIQSDDPSKAKLLSLMEFLRIEVESEERILLAREGFNSSKRNHDTNKNEEKLPTAAGLYVSNTKSDSKHCTFCNGKHETEKCMKSNLINLEEKKTLLKKNGCCLLCFKNGHIAKNCKVYVKCHFCDKRHHICLCPALDKTKRDLNRNETDTDQKSSNSALREDTENSTVMVSQMRQDSVILQTLLVRLVGQNEKKTVRLLFDSGAQRTYVKESSAKELKLPVSGEEYLKKTVFGGKSLGIKLHTKFTVTLEGLNGKLMKIEALGENVICGKIPRVQKGQWIDELVKRKININDFGQGCPEIEILIGSDYYGKLLTGRICHLDTDLTAIETIFGWTLSGRTFQKEEGNALVITNLLTNEFSVADLWKLETIGIMDPIESITKQERENLVKENFKRTVCTDEEGRYEVSLPWKLDSLQMPDNKVIAEKRLMNITLKLRSHDKISCYHKVFQDWLLEEIIEEVPKSRLRFEGYYLPHRPVFKDSKSTPVRPVFDASCKTKDGLSLNEYLEKGPNLLEMIPFILLKFREGKIGVTSDIRKAFLMVSVAEDERDFLRFLWWESPTCDKMIEYRHRRVVFGLNCSPFLLAAVIENHLENAPEELKNTAEKIKECIYVDNCITSVNSYDELELFKKEAVELMANAKMDLRMWECSKPSSENIIISFDQPESETNVLGIRWNKDDDTLSCDISKLKNEKPITKRNILSLVQKIYDPIGFLSPSMLHPKILLQEAWLAKIGWDVELSEDIKKKFESWLKQVNFLSQIKVPRWIISGVPNKNSWSLHVFCDASQKAYAAAVFLRSFNDNGISVRLLQGKARVAPLKPTTIPRLELLACVLGSRLVLAVKKAIVNEEMKVIYWSDSTTAITWIKGNKNLNVFVKNRVQEILRTTSINEWRHIPGPHNPADLLSRGCDPKKLLDSRWWEGPQWLKDPEEKWPSEDFIIDEEEIGKEIKKSVTVTCSNEETKWYKNFSSYTRVVRIIGWMRRLLPKNRNQKQRGELTVDEINVAEETLIKLIQKESFPEPKTYGNLNIVRDEKDLLRVKTKIIQRQDSYNFLLPFLMPSKHPLVESLIREEHLKNCHAGIQILMTKLREKFWIIHSRKTIRKIRSKCMRCKRYETKNFDSEPVALPKNRVIDTQVFQSTGIDLAGPLYLKDGNKVWISLFTCAVYRAIHLELVSSLSTDSFLQALRRFIARRGRPSIIYSDNGTNFIGAENAFSSLDWNYITAKYATEKIQWRFTPPTGPWWGGWWERLIRIIKNLLLRTLGKSTLSYEELNTLLCDVEAVVNSRPLTYVSEDSEDLLALTPAMFLGDIVNVDVIDINKVETNNFGRRYRYRQRLREDLKNRFRKEYLSQLVQRRKENNTLDVKLGDIVLIDNSKKKLEWPLAKIVKLYPGVDGKVRVVRVKTSSGEFIRPIQRLYYLERDYDVSTVNEGTTTIPSKSDKIVAEKPTKISSETEKPNTSQKKEKILKPEFTRYGREIKKPLRFPEDKKN